MSEPETRESLLIRLRDTQCDAAWTEFVVIYRPMIYRLARQSGLQHNDAEDVTQQVLLSVSRAVGDWRKDERRGRFRGWLTTVTKNAVRNAIRRVPRERAGGGSRIFDLLAGQGSARDGGSELDHHIEAEYRRSVLRTAAERVRYEFAESTWQAFWLTTVGKSSTRPTADDSPASVAAAAAELGITVGAVYAARSRVMRRLQEAAHEILDEEEWT
ncbi:MAG: sigma-70 family RNA polymerase sigma factor [Planctomycetales bacterium]|nr:sigma-70 family RNA polymerase sigma factor [Planctomycetales bacterium]